MRLKASCAVLGVVCVLLSGTTVNAQAPGRFVGDLDVRIGPDGRNVTLLAPYAYIDPSGFNWSVPRGVTVNGASIPQPLWSIVGSPWTGKYREASVIHDYFCDTRSQPWQKVHRMFYDAMLANGVSVVQAKAMYAAVYRFGPRWAFEYTPKCANCAAVPYRVDLFRPQADETRATSLYNETLAANPSLEDIERDADAQFLREIQSLEFGTPVLLR